MSTNMNDYRMENGCIDWDRYHKAQVAAGEKCKQCGAYIISINFFSTKEREPGPRKCFECDQLEKIEDDSVSHPSLVRCPNCWKLHDVTDGDDYRLYQDGEHDVYCHHCDTHYTIVTHVSFEFESPARTKEQS